MQKVKHGRVANSIFPAMFGRINNLLQTSIMGKNLQEVHPDLPSGIIQIQEGYLKSIPIPGATDCFIQGRFDILTKLPDGTHTIIDFKITPPDQEKLLKRYSSQLQAYKFALENPARGVPYKISKMGIVSVNPEEMKLRDGKIVFTAVPRYHEVKDDSEGFFSLIREVSNVLNGEQPLPTATCGLCTYRSYFIESPRKTASAISTSDIPF